MDVQNLWDFNFSVPPRMIKILWSTRRVDVRDFPGYFNGQNNSSRANKQTNNAEFSQQNKTRIRLSCESARNHNIPQHTVRPKHLLFLKRHLENAKTMLTKPTSEGPTHANFGENFKIPNHKQETRIHTELCGGPQVPTEGFQTQVRLSHTSCTQSLKT